jgi:hypothetical protein
MGPAAASIFDNISFAGSLDANLVSRLPEPYYRISESESHGYKILLYKQLKNVNIPFASQIVCQD